MKEYFSPDTRNTVWERRRFELNNKRPPLARARLFRRSRGVKQIDKVGSNERDIFLWETLQLKRFTQLLTLSRT